MSEEAGTRQWSSAPQVDQYIPTSNDLHSLLLDIEHGDTPNIYPLLQHQPPEETWRAPVQDIRGYGYLLK